MTIAYPSHDSTDCAVNADTIKYHLVRWLLDGGMGFQKEQDAIGNEVLFSSKWRRADLLLLSDRFHALEVKSDVDSLSRLKEQLADYHQVFDKVSVVTTAKQLRGVQKAVTAKTGVIVVDNGQPRIVRQARITRRLNRNELSRFINRATLTTLLESNKRGMSTDELRQQAATAFPIRDVRRVAYDILRQRYIRLFRLFLCDIGPTNIFGQDDLRSLCGKVDVITL